MKANTQKKKKTHMNESNYVITMTKTHKRK